MSDPRYSRYRVRAHYRADGTYVRSHYRNKRSAPVANTGITGFELIGGVLALLFFIGLIGANMPTP
ncbi:hypothetical protein ACFW3Z_09565 [Nocardiopsis alba]|jgi:hypothetical protein|uniref:hypothetical protein n=1 Tax=Nocardiopsis alba TaxID=53437 RepID=UPI0033B79687